MSSNKEVACPTCKKRFQYSESKFRPFCCERCKEVDLGHWFNEEYSVAGAPAEPEGFETLDSNEEEY